MNFLNFLIKIVRRLKIPNRKLLVAWIALLSSVVASAMLGYSWGEMSEPLIFGDEICKPLSLPDKDLYLCRQDGKEYLVEPLTGPEVP